MSFMRFFDGMVVVITGASSGFGAEFARQLAPVADTLLLVALEKELLENVMTEVTLANPSLKVIYAIFSKEEVMPLLSKNPLKNPAKDEHRNHRNA